MEKLAELFCRSGNILLIAADIMVIKNQKE